MATLVEIIRDLQIRRGQCVAEIADIERQLAEARDYLVTQLPPEEPADATYGNIVDRARQHYAPPPVSEQRGEPGPELPLVPPGVVGPDPPADPALPALRDEPAPATAETPDDTTPPEDAPRTAPLLRGHSYVPPVAGNGNGHLKPHIDDAHDRDLELKVTTYLRNSGFCALKEILKGTGLTEPVARLFCARLCNRGVLVKKGQGPSLKYGLADPQQAGKVADRRARLAAALEVARAQVAANGHVRVSTELDDETGWTGKCAQCGAIVVVEMLAMGQIEQRGRALTKRCLAETARPFARVAAPT